MGDYTDYLQGEYDGNEENKELQKDQDIARAKKVAEDIKMSQDAIFEFQTEALSSQANSSKEFEEICNMYNTQDKFQEYLVDGAILQCTMATMDDFELSNGEKVVLEDSGFIDKNVCMQMILHVKENLMDINGRYYATIKDCVKGVNIFWPICNCMVPANREIEEKNIMNDNDRNRFGVCRHLMRLNEEWDNMQLMNNNKYMTKRNVFIKADAPNMDIEDMPEEYFDSEDIEGITMTSVLFCKHGGLICPITSGQENIIDMEAWIQALVEGVKGNPVNSKEEMFRLSTMEILSRLIYNESDKTNRSQNAILFSLVNRLFTNTNVTRRTNTNNIYSIITGANQYEAISKQGSYKPNAFIPPNENSSIDELNAWENAKRLAAILYIAIEENGENKDNCKSNERNESVVAKGDMTGYQQVVDFIEQQTDTANKPIINEIETRESFLSGNVEKNDQEICIGGNRFFWK